MQCGLRTVATVLLVSIAFLTACSLKPGESTGSASPAAATSQAQSEGTASSYDATPLGRMLRPRTAKAELLVLVAPPDIEATAAKLKALAMRNPEAFADLASKRDADNKIVYDERMGVSKEAYERMLGMPELSTLTKSGDFELVIARDGAERAVVSGIPQLSSLAFDLARQTVESPFGKLAGGKPFEPDDNQPLTGPIRGVNWRSDSIESREDFSLWRATVAESAKQGDLWLILAVRNNLTGKYLLEYWVRVPAAEK